MNDIETKMLNQLLGVMQAVGSRESQGRILKRLVKQLQFGVITELHAIDQCELLCDPAIWVADDLNEITLDEWNEHPSAFTVLSERSIELGDEVLRQLEYDVIDFREPEELLGKDWETQ